LHQQVGQVAVVGAGRMARLRSQGPDAVRKSLGDGNYAGRYQRSDNEMLAIWDIAVTETREVISDGW
jgi:creatinine amidohydrolase